MGLATGVRFADGTVGKSKKRFSEFVANMSKAKANFVNCDVHAKIMPKQKVKDFRENNIKKLIEVWVYHENELPMAINMKEHLVQLYSVRNPTGEQARAECRYASEIKQACSSKGKSGSALEVWQKSF